jgi:hypothetical protein
MSLLDAFWHLIGFITPAISQGLLSAALAKLIWRRELVRRSWSLLAIGASAAALIALVAGLVLSGRDGTMAAYGAMVIAAASAIWWLGFVRR